MIDKIIKFEYYIYDKFLILLYYLNILPNSKRKKISLKIKKNKMDSEFNRLNIKDKKFYSIVDPLPSPKFFNDYYSTNQWEDYRLKLFPIKKRDLEHFQIIKENNKNFRAKKLEILNFGSGHAGFSILCDLIGHNVTNLDYFFNENITDYKNIKQISNLEHAHKKFDLIYASHALEHVTDIFETINDFMNVSHSKTKFFFEVPNCFKEENKKIKSPHTYYFTREFFINLFPEYSFCNTWKNHKKCNEDEGHFIRIYGEFRPNTIFLSTSGK
jgi:2-polyprenyl-3-methyl-5-hydroxy-6-metoxy-1,4-benzoquinol methylase